VDKPQIQYAVEEALACGIEDFIVVTGKNKRSIEDHFDTAFQLECNLLERGKQEALDEIRALNNLNMAYIRQGVPRGLGHAILCARNFVREEPFAVLLSDDVIDPDDNLLGRMVEYYHGNGAPVLALMEVPPEDVSKYGIVRADPADGDGLFRIHDLVEKPPVDQAPSNLAIIGRYVLTPDIFPALEETPVGAGGEIQLTDGIRILLRRRQIYGYLFRGNRYDAGDKLGYLKATVELALKNETLRDPFRVYLQDLVGRL